LLILLCATDLGLVTDFERHRLQALDLPGSLLSALTEIVVAE
jgi:hypothetical protein